ncbi:MAG: CoA-binding protein [Bilophila wadsworthia]
MGILINKNTKVVVQGITGREGSVRTKYMKSYGTHVVGGTSPGKKGSDVHGVPVYNTVKEIAREHGEIDFSVIFVPGHVLKTAVMEAADAGVKNVIPCVEGTPIHDIMEMIAYCKAKGTRLLGPGSIGIITPGEAVVGWLGGNGVGQYLLQRGSIGVFSQRRPVGNILWVPAKALRRARSSIPARNRFSAPRWRICFRCSRKIPKPKAWRFMPK